MAAAAEPFASIPVDILQEILLQLPSSVSLVRAALVSKQWGGIISNTDFLDHYRKLHPSSPLLGIFSSERLFGLPGFSLMDSVRSDTDLKAVERGADFLLVELEQDPSWRIRDSRNGHLLLCRPGESDGDSFSIYNPISRRLVTIPVDRPHDRVAYFADCLLVDGAASFRVVSVQQHQGRIRAVDYDPHKLQWRFSNWESPWALDRSSKLKSWALEPMHAAGLIFWLYGASLALVLDCSSMKFSVCSIPVSIRSSYAIGEIEDGVGCLVCLDDVSNDTTHGSFKVWLLNTSGGTITWEMSGDQITVTELLGEDARVRQVVLVTNGLALLSYDDRYDQFVIDLKNRRLHDDIVFRGKAYPYQMPWPPHALLSLRDICQEEAQPVQLVLPVDFAPALDDVDIAAPVDDVGLAAPLDDVDLAAQIDDVAYTEEPSDVVWGPLDVCSTKHSMASEPDKLAGTVKDAVRLMETKSADTPAPSADLVGGMPQSSEVISIKPRYDEVLHSARDVPPEQKDQGHIILSDSHVNADVQELVELGEVHMKLVIEFYSKAKAMLQGTSAVRDVMVEHPNSSAPPEGTCKGHVTAYEADNLVGPVEDVVHLMETKATETAAASAALVEAGMTHSSEAISRKQKFEEEAQHLAAPIDGVELAAPIDDVDLTAWIDNVAYTGGELVVDLRPLHLRVTEHVMAAEADNFVGTVKDGVSLMEPKAAETTAPSANFAEEKTPSSEAVCREQRCEEVQLECLPEILPLLQTSADEKVDLDALYNHAANRSNIVTDQPNAPKMMSLKAIMEQGPEHQREQVRRSKRERQLNARFSGPDWST
ncbi:uncharacterized protein [Lolium perenne]|uniref:uncharacterized protein isoform X4 n=1 Tax=Lolium perenne TaxID=4522 RepID=UPI0021F62504|nr:uncharacterized protein LOC127299022 isoform X4 [Lolium perenne]